MMRSLSLILALGAGAAWADEFVEVERVDKRNESPRSMFLEFKLSPFTPLIDSDFASTEEAQRPYQRYFGGQPMLMGEIEVEYQFFQKFGSLAGGLSLGYAEKFGSSRNASSGDTITQSTALFVVPIKALLVYRFDWLKQKTHIPLVPYAKGAFVVMPWWSTNGGKVDTHGQFRGEGARFGLAGVLGLALELDFIDQRLARDFDSSVGVNHSYLFAEATFQGMNLFPAAGPSLNLSSQHFMFGIGLEF